MILLILAIGTALHRTRLLLLYAARRVGAAHPKRAARLVGAAKLCLKTGDLLHFGESIIVQVTFVLSMSLVMGTLVREGGLTSIFEESILTRNEEYFGAARQIMALSGVSPPRLEPRSVHRRRSSRLTPVFGPLCRDRRCCCCRCASCCSTPSR